MAVRSTMLAIMLPSRVTRTSAPTLGVTSSPTVDRRDAPNDSVVVLPFLNIVTVTVRSPGPLVEGRMEPTSPTSRSKSVLG
eukprot:1066583-Rhodomonas_salina.1